MPASPDATPVAPLTAEQFIAFQQKKHASERRAAAAAADAPGAPLNGRQLWERMPHVFDVDEEGRHSAAALAAGAAATAQTPQ